jgi:uncharacterized phage protein gp47/JayE
MKKRQWMVLDSWAYVKTDATTDNVEATRAQMKASWANTPGARVRVFQRTVRAGGAGIAVTCIVAQAPKPEEGATPKTGDVRWAKASTGGQIKVEVLEVAGDRVTVKDLLRGQRHVLRLSDLRA